MSELTMSPQQAKRYAKGKALLISELEMHEVWGPDVIDLDAIELGVFRCPVGGDHCTGNCAEGDCWCVCDHLDLWESALNVEGWKPTCDCGREAHLVEVVGRWGQVKNERRREKLYLRQLGVYPAVRTIEELVERLTELGERED